MNAVVTGCDAASRPGLHPGRALHGDEVRLRGDAGTDLAGNAGAAEAAIAAGILGEVLLMIVLGEIELRRVLDLRRDGRIALGADRCLIGLPRSFGGAPLRRRRGVDSRAILRADVVTLAHALRWVMALPERLQQLLVGDFLRVID